MTDRLSALDATFLELEQADTSAHMHIGAVMVFEPGDGTPSLAAVADVVRTRLDAFPRHRQRLSSPRTEALRLPAWVDDEAFDPTHHLRRAALPAPGGEQELLDWAGEFFSARLDRRRPLWEAAVVEGLAGGRWAIATKTHHCMVDGVGAVDAAQLMLDRLPAAVQRGSNGANGSGIGGLAGLALHPERLLGQARALGGLLLDEVVAAPACSLNVPIGEHRRLVVARARLADMRAIKRALGGSINDVVLACVAGGLRELLLARGEEPPEPGLRVMVPVSLRSVDDRSGLGNFVSSLFVDLPVAEADPLLRHARIVRTTGRAKQTGQAAGGATLLTLAALAPPVLHAVVARPVLGTRLFNLTVTNVPGPPRPLTALGSRCREMIPLVPLAAEHALGVAVLSYAGRVVFCANCDRDLVPDADVFASGVAATLRELRRRAR